jgi:hypothetical protein
MKEQPAAIRKAVHQELRRRGFLNEWLTNEDWDWLAAKILENLDQGPKSNWVQLANRLIRERKPVSKRITLRNIGPLVKRMKAIRDRYEELKKQKTRPTKEEILASLTDDEIMERFGERVLRRFFANTLGVTGGVTGRTSSETSGPYASMQELIQDLLERR